MSAFNINEEGVLIFADDTTEIPAGFQLIIIGKKAKVIDLSNLRNLSSLLNILNHPISSWAKAVEKVILPDSMTKIDDRAFEGCENLTEIIMSDDVTEIGEMAFYGCRKLSGFKFPSSLKSIGEAAFKDCGEFTELRFPDSLESIGERAFANCNKVKEITFGQSLKSIGKYAFDDCDSLQTVTYTSAVANIDKDAFGNREDEFESVFEYDIDFDCLKAKSWREVEQYRDQDPLQLKVVDLSDCDFKELPINAFADCENLQKVTLPEGLKEISIGAFRGCYNLRHLEIPESVETINCNFDDCGIEHLVMPKSLRSLFTNGLKYVDMSHCESIRFMDSNKFSIGNARVVYLPPVLEKLSGNLYEIENCFAPPTLQEAGGIRRVRLYCPSEKLALSRDIDLSVFFVPEANIENVKSSLEKLGLSESRVPVAELATVYSYMYQK